jgi:hypothetical protein
MFIQLCGPAVATSEDDGSEVQFAALASPTWGDLEKLAHRIIPRLRRPDLPAR